MIDYCSNSGRGQEGQIRAARPEDADLLLRAIDMASDGVLPQIWAGYVPEGVDPMEVGRGLVLASEGQFSYRLAWVIEDQGMPVGALMGYRLPEVPDPMEEGIPEVFLPVVELEGTVPGYWYINVIAVLPEVRGKGLGAALVAHAEAQARACGAPGVALIVAASNEEAVRFYRREGFGESGRSALDARAFGRAETEAVLMTRPI